MYATFLRRCAALLLDGGLVAFLGLATSRLLHFNAGTSALLFLLLLWIYKAGMEGSAAQGTVGKLALDLKVTSGDGAGIGPWRATGRFVAFLLSGCTLGIGFVIALFTDRRQALHDLLADTLVIRRGYDATHIAATPAAPQRSAAFRVAVIVGVLLLVPGLGVLGTLVMWAYTIRDLRAQVAEVLRLAVPIERAAGQALVAGQAPASISTASLGLSPPPATRYLAQIEVRNAAVVIRFGGVAHPLILGHQLVLYPVRSGNELIFVCGYARPPGARLDLDNSASLVTDIREDFLPRECRAG